MGIASAAWNGVEAVKENLASALSRSMERVGSSFNSTKSNIFNIPSASWNHMKFHLVLQDSAIQAKERNTKTRVRRMRCGLTCTSESDDRKWKRIRLEMLNELEALKKMLGPRCTMGVTKGRHGKAHNCKALLNENDTTNIVLPINDKPEFRRRNATTY